MHARAVSGGPPPRTEGEGGIAPEDDYKRKYRDREQRENTENLVNFTGSVR